MPIEQVDGWTILTDYIASDSRIVYVSNNGDDTLASQAKGRGYYIKGDTEIGNDPTQPSGEIVAYKTYAAARQKMRSNEPDWLLFSRGDTFTSFDPAWTAEAVQVWRGRSAAERAVIAAYGDPALPRPILLSGQMANSSDRKRAFFFVRSGRCVVASLEPRWSGDLSANSGPALINIREVDTSGTDILLEDIFFRGSAGAVSGQRLTLRRCVIVDAFNAGSGHVQGIYAGGSGLVVEECVFDRNGYKEDPNNPFTWTRSVNANGMAAGTGVQPRRDFYCRNMYLTEQPEVPPTLRGNIISRGAGGSSVQMRDGGIAERNLFIWNEQPISTSHQQRAFYKPMPSRPNWIGFNSTEKKYRFNTQTQEFDPNGDILRVPTPGVDFPIPNGATRNHVDAVVSDNLVLHDDHMLPPGGWGIGLMNGGSRSLVVTGNIVTHFHRGVNSAFPGVSLGGIVENNSDYLPNPRILLETAVMMDNAVLRQQVSNGSTVGLLNLGGSLPQATRAIVENNAIAATQSAPKLIQNRLLTSGDHQIDNNLYLGTTNTPVQYRKPDGTIVQENFAQYQQDTQWETNSQYFRENEFEAFKTEAGWISPERDIVSYMQSIDPTYVINEDVTTDDGVPEEKRRSNARLVRDVLRDPSVGGYTAPYWGDSEGMTEARARLIARRYHAFITFIERAKANRKGIWDTRYTADALNSYIREGFGKDPVGGSYDETPFHERIENLTNFYFEKNQEDQDKDDQEDTFPEEDTEFPYDQEDTLPEEDTEFPYDQDDQDDQGEPPQSQKGQQGYQGSQGPQGLKGDSGAIGNDGSQGRQGIQGIRGEQGLKGMDGSVGSIGSQGYQGIQGLRGDQGVVGESGIQGKIGPQGPQGMVIFHDGSTPKNQFVRGSNFGVIERIFFNRDYLIEMSVPSERRIVGLVGETLQGNCILEVYRNSELIDRMEISPKRSSIEIFENNSISEGDDIILRLVQTNRLRLVREVKYSIHHEQIVNQH